MSDRFIRLAAGQLTAYQLLSNDNYLVSNWARTDDMPASIQWQVSQPEKGLQREFVQGLGRGTGGYYGNYSGILSFFLTTPQMRQYIYETFMSAAPIAMVTAYVHVPNNAFNFDEMAVVYGELISPIASNSELEYTRFNNHLYHTLQFQLRRASVLSLETLATISDSVITTLDGKYLATLDQ